MASNDGLDLCEDSERTISAIEVCSLNSNDPQETSPEETGNANRSEQQLPSYHNEGSLRPDSHQAMEVPVVCENSEPNNPTEKATSMNRGTIATKEECGSQSRVQQSSNLPSYNPSGIDCNMMLGTPGQIPSRNKPGQILQDKASMDNKEGETFQESLPISTREMSNVPKSTHEPTKKISMFQETDATTERQGKYPPSRSQSNDAPSSDQARNEFFVTESTHSPRVSPYPKASSKSKGSRKLNYAAKEFIPRVNPHLSSTNLNVSRNIKDMKRDSQSQITSREQSGRAPQTTKSVIFNTAGLKKHHHQRRGNESVAIKQPCQPPNAVRNESAMMREMLKIERKINTINHKLRFRRICDWLKENEAFNRETYDAFPLGQTAGGSCVPQIAIVPFFNQSLQGQPSTSQGLRPILGGSQSQSASTGLPIAVSFYDLLRPFVYQQRTEDVHIFLHAPDLISAHRFIQTFTRQTATTPPPQSTYSLLLSFPRCGILTKVRLWYICNLLESLGEIKSFAASARSVILLIFSLTAAQMESLANTIRRLLDLLRPNVGYAVPIILVGNQVSTGNEAIVSTDQSSFNERGWKIKARHDLSAFLECPLGSYEAVDSVILNAIDVSSLNKTR